MPAEKYSKSKYKKRAGTRKRKRKIKQNIPYKVPRTGPGPNDTPSPRMDGTLIPLSRMDGTLIPLSRMDESLRPQGKMNRPLLNMSSPRADMTALELAGTFRTNDQPSNLENQIMYRGPITSRGTKKITADYLTIEVNKLDNQINSLERIALDNGYNVLNPNWNDKKESSEWSVLPNSTKLNIAETYHAKLKKHLNKRAKKERKASFNRDTKRIHSRTLKRSLKNLGLGLPILLGAQLSNIRESSVPEPYQTPLLPSGDPNVRSRISSKYPFKQIVTDPSNPEYYSQTIGQHNGINLQRPGAIEAWDDIVSNAVRSQQPMTEETIAPYINPEHAKDNKQYTGPAAHKQITRRQLKQLKKKENTKKAFKKQNTRQKQYTRGTRPRKTHR